MDRNTFEGKVSNNPPKLVQATGAETGRLGGEIVTRALGDPVLSLVTGLRKPWFRWRLLSIFGRVQ